VKRSFIIRYMYDESPFIAIPFIASSF